MKEARVKAADDAIPFTLHLERPSCGDREQSSGARGQGGRSTHHDETGMFSREGKRPDPDCGGGHMTVYICRFIEQHSSNG